MKVLLIFFFFLIAPSSSLVLKAINDQQGYLLPIDYSQISNSIKQIENYTSFQLTLVITSSLSHFALTNRLPPYMNTIDIKTFTNQLHTEMYKGIVTGNKSILVVFSVNEHSFFTLTGSNVQNYLTNGDITRYFNDISHYLQKGNYSVGIRTYIYSLKLHLSSNRPNNKSGSNFGYYLIITIVIFICCCLVAFIVIQNSEPQKADEVRLIENHDVYMQISPSYPVSKFIQDNCVICLTPFVGESYKLLPCGHRFHFNCHARLSSNYVACPVCANNWHNMQRQDFIYAVDAYRINLPVVQINNYDYGHNYTGINAYPQNYGGAAYNEDRGIPENNNTGFRWNNAIDEGQVAQNTNQSGWNNANNSQSGWSNANNSGSQWNNVDNQWGNVDSQWNNVNEATSNDVPNYESANETGGNSGNW